MTRYKCSLWVRFCCFVTGHRPYRIHPDMSRCKRCGCYGYDREF